MYRMPAFPVPLTNKELYFSYPCTKQIKNILEKEKIDILHFMVPTPLSLSAVRAARTLNLPIAGHSHTQPENWLVYLPQAFKKILKRLSDLSYLYLIWAYDQADAIICPSAFSEKILKLNILKSKTYIISNGVDRIRFRKQNSKKYVKNYHFSAKTKKLLFVGRLDPEKNVQLLLKAVKHIEKQFKNFEVCLVGNGFTKKDMEKLSRDLKITERVKFLGKVSDEELVRIYNFCDIFVLPSLIELEGMVVLEAMACKKPILIADAPNSASRFFVNGNGFLFNPFDAKDLADKALRLLKDNKLYKKMAEQSLRISKKFDINDSISKLEKVYYAILNRN